MGLLPFNGQLKSPLRWRPAYVPVVALFAVIGTVLLVRSFAANENSISIEAELGTPSGTAAALDDTAASGGKVMRYNAASTGPVPIPPNAVPIQTSDDPQIVINSRAAGTAFVFKGGVHRNRSISPRSGDSFYGETGAVLNGSTELSFTQQGSVWVANGIANPGGQSSGECDWAPRCMFHEMLYFNDSVINHTDALAKVNNDNWFYDYTANKIYIGRNPAGAKVEVATTRFAFNNESASNVTVKGLTIEKYASPSQAACVQIASGWVVEANTIQLCHGNGLNITGNGSLAKNNKVLRNGKSGIGATGSDNVFDGNEVAYNNSAGFNSGWDAGGSKFAFSTRLTVRNNDVHHNLGPGLWTDIDNYGTLYENNYVHDNRNEGIHHEISHDAIIRNNTVENNGHGFTAWVFGAGILIYNSDGVEVYGNTLRNNAKAIAGICQNRAHWRLDNLNVHDNTIINSGQTGVAQDFDCGVYQRNIRFEGNHYSGSRIEWGWDSSVQNWDGWRSYGHDDTGSYTP